MASDVWNNRYHRNFHSPERDLPTCSISYSFRKYRVHISLHYHRLLLQVLRGCTTHPFRRQVAKVDFSTWRVEVILIEHSIFMEAVCQITLVKYHVRDDPSATTPPSVDHKRNDTENPACRRCSCLPPRCPDRSCTANNQELEDKMSITLIFRLTFGSSSQYSCQPYVINMGSRKLLIVLDI